MKTKILLLLFFVALWRGACAQFNLGDAVVTKSGVTIGDPVVKVYQIGGTNINTAPIGDNWGLAPTACSTSWTCDQIGQVFGVAINTNSADHLIYASATQIYPSVDPITGGAIPAGLNLPPTQTPGGAPMIWTLDPITCIASVLVRSSSPSSDPGYLPLLPVPTMYNNGMGLGNITYDKTHRQIFVTNMEDGRIYRIDESGHVLSRYDPFTLYTWASCLTSGVVTAKGVILGERVWGICYNDADQKLYFSAWNQDFGWNTWVDQLGPPNMIYSVGIDASGEFIATLETGATADFQDPGSTLEIMIPPIASDPNPYSNPVASINVSADGQHMLLAERTVSDKYGPNSGDLAVYAERWAHRARVLEYDKPTGHTTWSPSPNNFYVGNYCLAGGTVYSDIPYNNTNCAGGADFGYNLTAPDSLGHTCDSLLWATGDALKYPDPGGYPGPYTQPTNVGYNEWAYGFAGIPLSGNHNYAGPPTNSTSVTTVDNSSFYQDVFAIPPTPPITAYDAGKSRVGSIAVFKSLCSADSCSAVANINFSFGDADTVCIGQAITITGTGGPYGQFIIYDNNGHVSETGIVPVPITGLVFSAYVGNNDPGWHRVCFVAYSANPDSTAAIPCSDTACRNVFSQYCNCDSLQGRDTLIMQLQPNMSYNLSDNTDLSPDYILWYADGVQIGETTGGGYLNYTFGPGKHVCCMKAAYVFTLPNGSNVCCYDEKCDTVDVDTCSYWKSTAEITYQSEPGNYHNVDFTYTGNVAPPPTIVWNWGDGNSDVTSPSSSPSTTTHYYNTPGTYPVCAVIIWSLGAESLAGDTTHDSLAVCCCVDSICFTITVNPCSVQPFDVVAQSATTTTSPDFVINEIYPVGATILSTVWTVNGVVTASTIPSVLNIIPPPGVDTICAFITYTFSAPGELPDTCSMTACTEYFGGMETPEMIRYYPNPAQNTVIVEVKAAGNENASVELLDNLGRTLRIQAFTKLTAGKNQIYLDLDGVINGLYQMRVTIGGTVKVVKLVKD
jgi:hypothetical protein